jgi:spermidine synthase
MLNTILTRTFGLSRWVYRAIPWTTFFSGLGAGWILLALFQQFLAQLGCSNLVISAIWCMTGLAWAFAWGRPVGARSDLSVFGSKLPLGLIHPCVILAIVAAGPLIWPLNDLGLSDASLGSSWLLFAYVATWALVMLAAPVWCVARMAMSRKPTGSAQFDFPSSESTSSPVVPAPHTASALFVFGAAVGICLAPSFSGGNLFLASVTSSVLVLAIRIIMIRQDLLKPSTTEQMASGSALSGPSAGSNVEVGSSPANWVPISMTLACGGLLAWLSNVIGLLLINTIFTFTAIVTGTLLGVAFGLLSVSVRGTRLSQWRLGGSLALIASSLSLTAGFTFVIYPLISLAGSVSQVWLLQGLRDLFVAVLTIPVGFVWSTWSVSDPTSRRSRLYSSWPQMKFLIQPGAGVVWAAIGGLLVQCWLLPSMGLSATAYLFLFGISAVSIQQMLKNQEFPRGILLRGVLTACVLAMISAPLVSHGIRPELASRLLFSTNVAIAERSGMPRSQLPFLDDSRLRQVEMGEHGVLTVWKSAMSRFQIRENGIPRGIVSTNGAVAPQASAEVLIALLPLTLHEQPKHVAILGAGGGVPIFTCLEAQELAVTLVESDAGLVSVLKDITKKSALASYWKEKRLSQIQVDPALWIAGHGKQYDVLISNPDQSAQLRSTAGFTQEFYRRAARRLTADGIFCQRYTFHDFGPGPMQTLSATLRSVFSTVMAVEVGPGEIAFLATNSEMGLIRGDVTERMQAIYATEAMASIGWDWTVMLTLGAYDAKHLDKIQELGRTRINSAMNGWFCTQLPPELMRWGAKPAEISQVLVPNTGKILNWLDEVSNRADLLRRLSEVRGQQELLSDYPDQYWAYRSQVRKQISTRPLSPIQKVKHEEGKSGLPPEDKRRLRYFQQLSKAIHTKLPTEIQRLEAFTTPYDPLVSLFVHQELAEIAARSSDCDPQLELEHRLHTLFFTTTNDRSVRNGLSLLRLLLDKPESVPSPEDRFDLLNTVLQSLQYRWESRTNAQPGSARELARDVEDNIVLGERALRAMTELAPEAGISNTDCEARERVIERKLLLPLRNYRKRLEPHVARQKAKQNEAELDGDLPSDDELKFPGAEKP